MKAMPSKTSNMLMDELEYAKYKGLIDINYNQTGHNSINVSIYFAEDIKSEARLNFARYLNRKYLLFNTKFRENYDQYVFSFCPLIMTIKEYFEEKHK